MATPTLTHDPATGKRLAAIDFAQPSVCVNHARGKVSLNPFSDHVHVILDDEAPLGADVYDVTVSFPPTPNGSSDKLQGDLEVLIGTRAIIVDDWRALWTFSRDGTAKSDHGAPTGKWEADGQNVTIRWDKSTAWERFFRPLNGRAVVRGDSWRDKPLLAKKVQAERKDKLGFKSSPTVGGNGGTKFEDRLGSTPDRVQHYHFR